LTLTSAFSFASSSWQQLANFGAEGRHRAASMSIGNKGYMGIGHYNGTGTNIVKSDWWEYDPATNSWAQKADFIGNGGNGNYAVLTFSMENSSVGYLGGGQLGTGKEFYKYSPATNTWTPVANIPLTTENTKGFTIGNSGYYINGSNLWKYDALANSWSNLGSVPFSVNLWNSAFAINGKGYIKTGFSLWEYKPLTNQWISRTPFPGLASSASVAFTQNGKGYIVGGYVGSLSNVNSEVWEFDPGLNQWFLSVEFPGTSRRFANGFNIGNRAFFGIGTNGTNFNDFWEFDAIAGVNDIDLDITVNAFPNPVVDVVHFKTSGITIGKIILFNSIGQIIDEVPIVNSKAIYSRQTSSPGVYYYQIESNGEMIYQNKLIFQ